MHEETLSNKVAGLSKEEFESYQFWFLSTDAYQAALRRWIVTALTADLSISRNRIKELGKITHTMSGLQLEEFKVLLKTYAKKLESNGLAESGFSETLG